MLTEACGERSQRTDFDLQRDESRKITSSAVVAAAGSVSGSVSVSTLLATSCVPHLLHENCKRRQQKAFFIWGAAGHKSSKKSKGVALRVLRGARVAHG